MWPILYCNTLILTRCHILKHPLLKETLVTQCSPPILQFVSNYSPLATPTTYCNGLWQLSLNTFTWSLANFNCDKAKSSSLFIKFIQPGTIGTESSALPSSSLFIYSFICLGIFIFIFVCLFGWLVGSIYTLFIYSLDAILYSKLRVVVCPQNRLFPRRIMLKEVPKNIIYIPQDHF